MSAITVQQRAYQQASYKPLSRFEIYEPMVSSAISVGSIGLSILSKLLSSSNYVTMGFALLGALPGLRHGTQLFTDWIPKMAWRMPKGEVIRGVTHIPNVKAGLAGWQRNSTHSNHFDENLANALVGLCQKDKLSSHADFECAGTGAYSAVMAKAGIATDGYDFSQASVDTYKGLTLATLNEEAPKQYDLVTSFEVVSKTLPGEEETLIKKLIHSTNANGTIAMSCAIPGQAGPNSNHHTNEEIIALFERNGCKYDPTATGKLRREANPMHLWLKSSIMVFKKGSV